MWGLRVFKEANEFSTVPFLLLKVFSFIKQWAMHVLITYLHGNKCSVAPQRGQISFFEVCLLLWTQIQSDLICNSKGFHWLIKSTLGTRNFEVVNMFNSIYELKYPEGAQVQILWTPHHEKTNIKTRKPCLCLLGNVPFAVLLHMS